jgi:hypothetical protein
MVGFLEIPDSKENEHHQRILYELGITIDLGKDKVYHLLAS